MVFIGITNPNFKLVAYSFSEGVDIIITSDRIAISMKITLRNEYYAVVVFEIS